MADVGEALASGGAITGVVVGASLTYLFGALNRRHQEAREDKTRWYEARLKAYTEFSQAAFDASFAQGLAAFKGENVEGGLGIMERFERALGTMLLLGSNEVQSAGYEVLTLYTRYRPKDYDAEQFTRAVVEFNMLARRDLGLGPLPESPGVLLRLVLRGWAQKRGPL